MTRLSILKKALCFGFILAITMPLYGCTNKEGKEIVVVQHCDNDTVFKMDNLKCSESEAKLYLLNTKNNYGTISGIDLWQSDFDTTVISDSIKSMTMAHLTKVYDLCLYAKKSGTELTENEAMMVRSAAAEYYSSLTEKEKEFTGISEQDLVEIYSRYALATKMNDLLMQSVDEEVSDDEARVIGAMVIFVTDKTVADEIDDKLKHGYFFENQAANKSELDSYIVTFGRGEYPENVEKIVFNLDEKKASEMIEADGGYYFFYVTNKYIESESEKNKENIREERRQIVLDEIENEVEKEYYSDINEELWNQLNPAEMTGMDTASMFTVLERYISVK